MLGISIVGLSNPGKCHTPTASQSVNRDERIVAERGLDVLDELISMNQYLSPNVTPDSELEN
jgi:hypothetical protein